jgi:hypothetical protein
MPRRAAAALRAIDSNADQGKMKRRFGALAYLCSIMNFPHDAMRVRTER